MYTYTKKQGRIEVICGCMFSGKSEELINRLRKAKIAKQKIQVFNSSLDKRYACNAIASHNKTKLESEHVNTASEILKLVKPSTTVVAVDEGNFFDKTLVDVCETLAQKGKRVIVSGVDLDYTGKPFEAMALLMAKAEFVTKNLAVCTKCGSPASRTQRIAKAKSRILVGAQGVYEARCRKCFKPGK
ncbi:Thymidine kinase [Elusimicrobium minutum Pei191]|uniref:Thymidine kinase n=2 Tax=Elusimicrobium TaxID=423604 RepID=B2KDH6_ELUMP|nr:thymidine kinase [Elusimicrobium minutum]ACC98572.1 Thymidine kinase [Elusimicrobium minutum Pei191]